MGKAVSLSTFGGQSLTDGTTYKQRNVEDSGDAPRNSLYLDINGEYFDAAASGVNTLVPDVVTCELIIVGSSTADHKAKTNLIEALNGTRATLTGAYADATTVTCTARCVVAPTTITTVSFLVPATTYNLTFKKITSWA